MKLPDRACPAPQLRDRAVIILLLVGGSSPTGHSRWSCSRRSSSRWSPSRPSIRRPTRRRSLATSPPRSSGHFGRERIDSIRSVSSENRSLVLAEFEFGVDMSERRARFPATWDGWRFRTACGSRQSGASIRSVPGAPGQPAGRPRLERASEADGISRPSRRCRHRRGVQGGGDGQDGSAPWWSHWTQSGWLGQGVSRAQVSRALSESNVALPAGAVSAGGQVIPVRASSGYGSVEEMRSLVVGLSGRPGTRRCAGAALGRGRRRRDG